MPASQGAKVVISPTGLIRTITFVSAGVLAFEIALMRVLLVASWHHFAFLIISIGLIGFGLSGTVLLFASSWLMKHQDKVLSALASATAVSMPLCLGVAQHVPTEARVVPALLWSQLTWWLLYWVILSVPFLLGATTIGLGLLLTRDRIAMVYAANLLGSGAGAAVITVAMWWIDPAWLAIVAGGVTLLGTAMRPWPVVVVGLCLAWLWLDPPHIRTDPSKYASHLKRLEEQGDVRRLARRVGPRGVVEAWGGTVFHELPFLSLGASPPPVQVLTFDGHWAASVLDINSSDQACAVEQTLMSIPYDLLESARPSVLMLGEKGGANIWLASRRNASRIVAVQPDPQLRPMLEQLSPALFGTAGLEMIVADPRQFVDRTASRFDLLQLVTLEGSAAGSSGIGGLGQDYLITVEGATSCLKALQPAGMLAVCRGIQTPPRDNLKLLATFVVALHRLGIDDPARHIVIVRDYLAVCTMVKRTAWTPDQIARVRHVIGARQLTPVWFDRIREAELNQPDSMPGPAGLAGDWYHHAAAQLFSPNASIFIAQWPFDIRPATDDRPFFMDFCRLSAIGEMRRAFGEQWLASAELAFLFALVASGAVTIVAAVATVLPLLLSRSVRSSQGLTSTTIYSGAIGLAYLLLEMALLARLTQLIGDPVLAAAATITTFLLGSGAGSLIVQRSVSCNARTVWLAVAGIVVMSATLILSIGPISAACGAWSNGSRVSLSIGLMLPMSVLMGIPMPVALRWLNRGRQTLVPWAWGVNGFTSVLAAPVGTVMGMTWGFSSAALAAIACYLAAALASRRLRVSAP